MGLCPSHGVMKKKRWEKQAGISLEHDCTTLQVLLGELCLRWVPEHPLGAVGLCAVIPRSRDPAAAAKLPFTPRLQFLCSV